MILIYTPEGGDKQEWKFSLGRVRVKEREQVELRTNMSWGTIKASLEEESTAALKGLLWMMLRRTHATYRWEDVDFCDEELTLVVEAEDYRRGRKEIEDHPALSRADKDQKIAFLDTLIAAREAVEAELAAEAAARGEVSEGKAQAPSDDTPTP